MTVQPTQGGANAVDAGRLWAGGAATAVVAALIAVVGILLARGVFDVPVLAPKGEGTWGDADTLKYALYCGSRGAGGYRPAASVADLHASAVAVLQLDHHAGHGRGGTRSRSSPTARRHRRWRPELINLVVGIAIGTLLTGAARSAMRDRRADRLIRGQSLIGALRSMPDRPGLRLLQGLLGRFADQLGGLEDADRSGHVQPVGTTQQLGEARGRPR